MNLSSNFKKSVFLFFLSLSLVFFPSLLQNTQNEKVSFFDKDSFTYKLYDEKYCRDEKKKGDLESQDFLNIFSEMNSDDVKFNRLSKTDVQQEKKNEFLEKARQITEDLIIAEKIFLKSLKYRVDPFLSLALVWQESRFKPDAELNGAYGLTQATRFAYVEYFPGSKTRDATPEKMKQVDLNLEIGIAYLSNRIRDQKGDMHKALMAYNGGNSYLRRNLKNNITSTSYSRSITALASSLASD